MQFVRIVTDHCQMWGCLCVSLHLSDGTQGLVGKKQVSEIGQGYSPQEMTELLFQLFFSSHTGFEPLTFRP